MIASMRCGVLLLVCLAAATQGFPASEEEDIITVPRPGEEYVFVQSSVAGAQPITRKDKKSTSATGDVAFETAHKIPAVLKFKPKPAGPLSAASELTPVYAAAEPGVTKPVKRAAVETPHPGAIKIDASKLIEKYRGILEATTKKPAPDATTANIVLTTGGPSTKRTFDIVSLNKSEKKTGGLKGKETTAKLASSSSEKQTSRIQIKKGPNGQDYEYEYIYYYYDDDEANDTTNKDAKTPEKVTNSHDGPARNAITPSASPSRGGNKKYSSIERNTPAIAEPASNEIVPAARSRQRGRQIEEPVAEERLPLNTRFPPRSRNLSTTPIAETTDEETTKSTRSRHRSRSTTTEAVTEELPVAHHQSSGKTRPRSNVRRPSLELVDSASFKTHASDVSVSQFKELPSRSEESTRRTNERSDEITASTRYVESDNAATATSRSFDTSDGLPREQALTSDDGIEKSTASSGDSSTTDSSIATTITDDITAAMDKVALDLYAILQGTQNMMETDSEEVNTDNSDIGGTTEVGITTEEVPLSTTEITTEELITTTTTTTTPAPTTPPTTTTTTTEPSTTAAHGRSKFRGRGGSGSTNRFRTSSSTSTTEASADGPTHKAATKGRFSPHRSGGFSGRRVNPRTTTEKSAESEVAKEDVAPASHSRPTIGNRSRFGSRGRVPSHSQATTSTAAPSEGTNSAPVSRAPGLTRPRTNFNLRRRGGTTTTTEAAPSSAKDAEANEEEDNTEVQAVSSTTARPLRPRIGGGAVRPLRPGPRINISPRGRIGVTTSTTPAPQVSEEAEESASEEVHSSESDGGHETTPIPVATSSESALARLRNRARLSINPNKPKASAPTPLPIARRVNPLLSRRKPIGVQAESTTDGHTNVEEPSEDKEHTDSTEVPAEDAHPEQSEEAAVSSTAEPEQPRGLNSLLAGRRRLVNRRPGTIL